MGRKEKFDDRLEAGKSSGGSSTYTGGKKKKKKVIWVIAALVVVVIAVIFLVSRLGSVTQQVEMQTNQTEVEPVQKRDLSDTISLKGSISGISKINVTSKAVSEITAMNVQVGDIVKAGDVLCTLDSVSIEEQIQDLEKSISNTNAIEGINKKQTRDALEQAKKDQKKSLDEAQEAITRAEEAYRGTQMMYDKGEADFASLLNAERAIEEAKKNYDSVLESTNRAIESAEMAVRLESYQNADSSTKDTLKSLREQLEDCEVKAPCGGVVTGINLSIGDINSEKVAILTIEDTSSLKLVASVAEADILKIKEGMKAVITADATGEEEIEGEVTRVVRVKSTGSMDSPSGYSVELSVKNNELLVGMDAKAKVMISDKEEILAVPYDMIRYDEDGSAYVLTADMNDDGTATAVRKNITLGDEVDYYTEVTGGDLVEGDLLVYDYTWSITEGQTFSVSQTYSGGDMGTDMIDISGTSGEVIIN